MAIGVVVFLLIVLVGISFVWFLITKEFLENVRLLVDSWNRAEVARTDYYLKETEVLDYKLKDTKERYEKVHEAQLQMLKDEEERVSNIVKTLDSKPTNRYNVNL